jgi:hypothetical protein
MPAHSCATQSTANPVVDFLCVFSMTPFALNLQPAYHLCLP